MAGYLTDNNRPATWRKYAYQRWPMPVKPGSPTIYWFLLLSTPSDTAGTRKIKMEHSRFALYHIINFLRPARLAERTKCDKVSRMNTSFDIGSKQCWCVGIGRTRSVYKQESQFLRNENKHGRRQEEAKQPSIDVMHEAREPMLKTMGLAENSQQFSLNSSKRIKDAHCLLFQLTPTS